MLRRIGIIIRKELVDNLRDRRSVGNALFAVLINPLLYIVLFGFLNRTFTEQAERPLELYVSGAANAPNLVQFLDQNNVDIREAPDDAEAAVRRGELGLVLLIPDDFGQKFRDGEPAQVQLLIDESSQSSNLAVGRAQGLIGQYSAQIGNLRLLARGVSPAVAVAVPVEMVNVAPQEAEGGSSVVLNLLPVVMMTAAFYGGFYLAVDTTAGERERKSLEPLLLNPVPRWEFLMGKFLAVFAFTLLATFLATALFLVLLGVPQVQEFTAIRVSVGWNVILTAMALMIPVVFMAVALEMAIGSYARSVKEASTYAQLVAFAGFLPSLFLSVLPIRPQSWMYLIPTVGQLYFINDTARGLPLNWMQVILCSAITLGIGIAALIVAMRFYNQERILLGTATA
ncbi:putative Na+ ABC transporter permease protein [Candidatus Promineifilum breve]|uniref:Na+ ABC transporter permease protein n=1 Tax=Candidatus Promineifilum breve TaxID=1806508 RepID=A0A160T4Q7_9CHLR|nr:ABC transporter permease [Candidatus Promineifilum breve]CUS04399.2 putative Na+ ABC transporter permease protein [Candidatus Promineifilum breve]